MKTCFRCKKPIDDTAKFCPSCGAMQGYSDSYKCVHCDGTGQCKQKEVFNRKYSCEVCVEKSGMQKKPFLVVLCSICGGKGYIEKEKKQQQQNQKKGGQRWQK